MEQNKALLERIRLFVLDLDGTIYLGDRLLPGAAEFIATAKEKGRRVLFSPITPAAAQWNMWSVFPAWGFLSPGRIFSRPGM